jgi:hypothetical protein
MEFPTPPRIIEPPETGGRAPVKTDLYDLDNLLQELNTPKEQIQPSRPMPGQSSFGGNNEPEYMDSPEIEPIPAEIAALSGKAIAGTIDTVLSTGLSLYAQAPSAEKYEASEKQIEKLNQAWGAVAQKYNYKVEDSPWFNVILLMVAIYFPIWKEAQKDHRFAELENRTKENELKAKEMEVRLKTLESNTAQSV